MKCDDCFNLLDEYIDGEAVERDATQVRAHLITCAVCAQEFEALTTERDVYTRYDRELEVSPGMWSAIAARTAESRPVNPVPRFSFGTWLSGLFAPRGYAFAGAAAVVMLALMIGIVYLRTRSSNPAPPLDTIAGNQGAKPSPNSLALVAAPPIPSASVSPAKKPGDRQVTDVKSSGGPRVPQPASQKGGDVLFTDAAYTDIADKETANHVAQAENLLRSVRSLQAGDDTDEIDVSYEKAESRRLLNENVVLRRDAEMSGNYPAKKMLGELEPFLIDIANLPDKTTPTDLRAINNRVQKTEIVAALRSY